MSEETEFIEKKRDDTSAPTVTIETVAIVRPIKVLSFLCCLVGLLFNTLSVAATSWLKSNEGQEGLWEKCNYTSSSGDEVDCHSSKYREWMSACRALSAIGLILGFISILSLTIGMQTTNYRMKYKYYGVTLAIVCLSALPDIISLIMFPVRFVDELNGGYWSIGWAYVVGWLAAILKIAAGALLFKDRNFEELVDKEVTTYGNDIEEYE